MMFNNDVDLTEFDKASFLLFIKKISNLTVILSNNPQFTKINSLLLHSRQFYITRQLDAQQ
jgi:hypothetical protein